jgi:chitin disaccharide deacetylase
MTAIDFARGRRCVVIHEDDVGMTHGANTAFVELSALGACSSGSVMVPCPWFPEVAEIATANPALDLGVHLTLTSEKKPYRWRPLTNPSRSAGLTDPSGFFWPDVPNVRRHAAPDAVEAELRAQIDTSIAAGLDITHLDAHMGTVMCPEFVDIYVRLGIDYKVPILLVRDYDTFNPRTYSGPMSNERYNAAVAGAQGAGFPIFDRVYETPWQRTSDPPTAYRELFATMPRGLSFLSLHFNAPGDFEVIEPEYAHIRTEEYLLFKTPAIREWVQENHLEVVGLREIRDRLRADWVGENACS